MEALISIPLIMSLPYSTSMNLLFFYMTWATLVLSHPPLRVEIVGTAVVRILFYLFPSTIFLLFDLLVPSAAVAVKAQGEVGLPTGSKRGRPSHREAMVVIWALLNLVLSILLQGMIEYALTNGLGLRSALKVSLRLPYPWDMAKDLLGGFISREILTYFIHRFTLHSSGSSVARYHRSWYHSLNVPYPLTAHYDHPIAYLLLKFLPTYGPAALFRYHMLTYILYLSLISLEETFAYSGYKALPTSVLIGGIARRADIHLLSGGDGNYGTWGIMDWVFGTSVADSVEDDLQEELDEEEVEKIRKVLESKTRAKSVKRRTRRRVNS